jgi:hypothetical protein
LKTVDIDFPDWKERRRETLSNARRAFGHLVGNHYGARLRNLPVAAADCLTRVEFRASGPR